MFRSRPLVLVELEPFYAGMSPDELTDYRTQKNTESIDGFPTDIFDG